MSIESGAFVITHPAFIEPEILLQYSQASGFTDLLADGQLRVRIAEDDLYVYMKSMNLRTKMLAGTMGPNELPGVNINTQMINTPTYLFKCRAGFDHHDVAAGARWGYSVPEAYTLGMRQANFQLARDAALYGLNPANSEGLINSPSAVSLNLPPDTFGNTTVRTYDNGQMAFFLAQQVLTIKTRTVQLGMGRKFTILGPQRTLGSFEYNIVQLVQYQRVGAGTQSTKGVAQAILMDNGDTLIWAYDDTLIGKGNGGADLVIVSMPEVEKPKGAGQINTNVFASMAPGNAVCNTQYCDMAAPREIVSPMAGGATDVMTEWRLTSGWGVRGEATTLISMTY